MSSGSNAVASYSGQKVSAVKWKPVPEGLGDSSSFVSGGWDDEQNRLCFWVIGQDEDRFLDADFSPEMPKEAKLVATADVEGSVTDIRFIDLDRFIVALSSGTVQLWRQQESFGEISLHEEERWEDLHQFCRSAKMASCTCLAVNRELNSLNVATGGEDGKISVIRLGSSDGVIRQIEEADCTGINGIAFVKAAEVVTAGMSGQLKLWDIRDPQKNAAKVMHLLSDQCALQCVDCHPDQWHLVAAGSQDGVLSIWDLRKEKYPVSLMQSHTADIWEVMFHRHCPNNLFSCSDDGSVLHWDASAVTVHTLTGLDDGHSIYSPWLAGNEGKQDQIQVSHLLPHHRLPVHSIDILSRHLVCGSDSEAVIVVYNRAIR